jgi:hypothetical protein
MTKRNDQKQNAKEIKREIANSAGTQMKNTVLAHAPQIQIKVVIVIRTKINQSFNAVSAQATTMKTSVPTTTAAIRNTLNSTKWELGLPKKQVRTSAKKPLTTIGTETTVPQVEAVTKEITIVTHNIINIANSTNAGTPAWKTTINSTTNIYSEGPVRTATGVHHPNSMTATICSISKATVWNDSNPKITTPAIDIEEREQIKNMVNELFCQAAAK